MTDEVQALRADHNYAPDTAIRNVAQALRRVVGPEVLDAVLDRLPGGAVEFWAV